MKRHYGTTMRKSWKLSHPEGCITCGNARNDILCAKFISSYEDYSFMSFILFEDTIVYIIVQESRPWPHLLSFSAPTLLAIGCCNCNSKRQRHTPATNPLRDPRPNQWTKLCCRRCHCRCQAHLPKSRGPPFQSHNPIQRGVNVTSQ